jgi:hypothetical protein
MSMSIAPMSIRRVRAAGVGAEWLQAPGRADVDERPVSPVRNVR